MKPLTIAISLVFLVAGARAAIAAELAGFFACAEILFFGSCPKTALPAAPSYIWTGTPDRAEVARKAVPPPSSKLPQSEESVWAEPVRGADGQLRVYLPPQAVRDFLEKPTRENARDYLAWNQARMRQIDEAVKVMRDVAVQQFGIPEKEPIAVAAGPSAPDAEASRVISHLPPQPFVPPRTLVNDQMREPVRGKTAARQISIVYAFAAWCPYSRQQTPIINQLAAHVPVRGLVFDSKPEEVQALQASLAFPIVRGDDDLRRRLGVRSYPTIFFFEGSRLHHVARGLQPPDHLVSVLTGLAGGQLLPAPEPASRPAGDTCPLRG